MTIQEAINKAIEGGYPQERVEDLALHVQVAGDFEYIQLRRGEPRKMREPMWLYYWHRFHSHLVAGKTPASFFETFPYPPEA